MRKRQWFFLGLLGTLIGMAVRLVKGRSSDDAGTTKWDPPSGN
jgi:hypothetical protein